jgi:ABC-type multidrug transport system fused ATPase/permease subunit
MTYPATFTFDPPEKVANWRPLVQWILALPHFIVLYLIQIVAGICLLISWLAIVITGKLPQGLADFICMANRYQTRVMAYIGFLHAEYPPFEFAMTAADPGGQPVRVDFVPALEDRNRLTVLLRFLWAIPAMLFNFVIMFVAEILWFIAFFAVLFTGKWPAGLLTFVQGALRVSTRTNAYLLLLTDEYPPFETN